MGVEEIRVHLPRAAAAVAAANAERDAVIATRDALIAEAREAGMTWVEIQRLSDLTPRGVALALKRAEKDAT